MKTFGVLLIPISGHTRYSSVVLRIGFCSIKTLELYYGRRGDWLVEQSMHTTSMPWVVSLRLGDGKLFFGSSTTSLASVSFLFVFVFSNKLYNFFNK